MDWITPLVWAIMVIDVLAFTEREREHRDRERKQRPDPDRDMEPKRRRPPTKAPGIQSQEEVFNQLLRKKRYSKSDPPYLDKPTEVKLGIYVNSFYSISEQTMDYSMSMYLRQGWNDPRLRFDPGNDTGYMNKISLADGWHKVWTPDTFFRNEKAAMFHDVTVSNRLMKLSQNGDIWYVTKISATLSCPMKLQKYPLDTQHCPMMFESFGYTMDTMYFAWLPSPVDIDPNVQLPQFTLKDEILYDCSQNYTAGAFPCLEIQFVFRRELGYYLMQIFIPSIMMVMLSWLSFWIDVDAMGARVGIGLLTVLALSFQNAGVGAHLPRVSYIKAVDIWFVVCFTFVFCSLLECAIVNVMSRRKPKGAKSVQDAKPETEMMTETEMMSTDKGEELPMEQINIVENGTERQNPPAIPKPEGEGKNKARRIDKISRKLFPMAFLLFNIIYWIVYTLPNGQPPGSMS